MDDRATQRADRRRRAASIALPALILLAAVVGHFAVATGGDRAERERLDRRSQLLSAALERRVRNYGDVLYGVHGLFRGSDHVTPEEFHANLASQRIFDRYPGVQVVGFAEVAGSSQVDALVARVRREALASGLGYPRFRLKPAAGGPQRAPITYLDPVRGNEPRSASTSSASRTAAPRCSARC
jgi:CHASE1-domain containing sensor protein